MELRSWTKTMDNDVPQGDGSGVESEEPERRVSNWSAMSSQLVGAAAELAGDSDWEELNLPSNVYSVAFILASNATEGMYSFWPHKNRQMLLVWFYLCFISFSQSFALMTLTVIEPPPAFSETLVVDCDRPSTSQFQKAAEFFNFAEPSACRAALQDIAFDIDLENHNVEYRYAKLDTPFFRNTFQGDKTLVVLQLVCCAWVMTHIYFRDFHQVELLMHFRDFNLFFLPFKGEELKHNGWVLFIPMLQWFISTAVVSVSWCLISGYDGPVDVVLNSMAFTFITEVAETFAEPVLEHYAKEAIHGLDPAEYGSEDIFYIVTEYDPANNVGDMGWYINLDAQKVGLITDFRIRLNTKLYQRYHKSVTEKLRLMFVGIPPSALALCYLHTEEYIIHIAPCMIALLVLSVSVAFVGIWTCDEYPTSPNKVVEAASPINMEEETQ